jgi:hypothetical protein
MGTAFARKSVGWIGGALVLAAAAWLFWSGVWFLGPAWPGRGVVISVPFDGSVTWNAGSLRVETGAVRLIDHGGWWMLGIGGPLALLVGFAWLGCRHLARASSGSHGRESGVAV